MKKTFEESLVELENIVKSLENKEVLLADAVNNYKKGLELSKECYEKLVEAESLIVKTASDMENFEVE